MDRYSDGDQGGYEFISFVFVALTNVYFAAPGGGRDGGNDCERGGFSPRGGGFSPRGNRGSFRGGRGLLNF
jgi:hypothetical protein